jgi:hypothetical protein
MKIFYAEDKFNIKNKGDIYTGKNPFDTINKCINKNWMDNFKNQEILINFEGEEFIGIIKNVESFLSCFLSKGSPVGFLIEYKGK